MKDMPQEKSSQVIEANERMGYSTMGIIQQGKGSVHHGYSPTREWVSPSWVHANKGIPNKLALSSNRLMIILLENIVLSYFKS